MSGEARTGRAGRAMRAVRDLNRQPALVQRSQALRAWALGDDDFVDRLSTARGRPADLAASRLVELRGEQPGVIGELGMTALQVWQRVSEAQGRGRGDVEVAVLFTDLAGFSSWALEAGDEVALGLLRQVSEAIEPPMLERRGEVVKRLGDGVMSVFWDAVGAVEAALAAHERAAAIEVDGYRPRLRTGIHLGRPRRVGGDYFGVDVNIAARLAEAAGADEILVSERTLAELGELELSATPRAFSAKGAPPGLGVHCVAPAGRTRSPA